MNRINYPQDTKKLHETYFKIISDKKRTKIDAYLNSITYKGVPLNLKVLLFLPIEELIVVKDTLLKHSNAQRKQTGTKDGVAIYKNEFADLFDYKGLQPELAAFFMRDGKFDLRVCHYCSIDYINSFADFPNYKNGIDFINQADKFDLNLIDELDELDIDKIIKGRPHNDYNSLSIPQEALNKIKSIPLASSHNHFTLDHLLPQGAYPFFSLCLYNLVPSCYSCNSKFKNKTEFDVDDDMKIISPTSTSFAFNESFCFKIFYSKQFENLDDEQDFELRKEIFQYEGHIQKYLKMFKILGRYAAHKSEILSLIQKQQSYPESKIQELANDSGVSTMVIKKMIFGEDLFDSKYDSQSFVKFRRDIANEIKIPGVLKYRQ